MKTYIFKVVIEPDEDRWFAYCPILKGCATWGYTKEEALKNIQEVVELWVKDMIEAGENIPVEEIESRKEKLVFSMPMVAVTIQLSSQVLEISKLRSLSTPLKEKVLSKPKRKWNHLIFRHQDGRRVVVSFHRSGNTFPPKTLKNMLEQARWTEEDLKRLKLLK